MNWKLILAYVGMIVGVIGYIPYLWGIYKNKVKPHAFTWFVWGSITAIAFVIQLIEHGGVGTWVTGLTAGACLFISGIAFYQGKQKFPLFDWISLVIAGIGLILWFLTDEPLLAVILITITDNVGFLPTYRKSWSYPDDEVVSSYLIGSIKFALGILALEAYSLNTWLYPAAIILTNTVFVIMVLIRRKQLAKGSLYAS